MSEANLRMALVAVMEERDALREEVRELLAELDGRTEEAAERWIQQQMAETGIRSMDFRNGVHMDLDVARDLTAHWVAAARTMLGDAPNYTETKLEFDVKVAESPEMYTLVVQRHAPGALTPHEARQKAEAERDQARAEAGAVFRQVKKMITESDLLCPYHGLDYDRLGWSFGEPGCDSCKRPYRANRVLAAIAQAEATEGRS